MLVTSIFSFFHNVFFSSPSQFSVLSYFYFIINLDWSHTLSFGKRLILYQVRESFRLVWYKSGCHLEIQCCPNDETFLQKCKKNTVGTGENAGHQHFLLFSQDFQKHFFSGLFKLILQTKSTTKKQLN